MGSSERFMSFSAFIPLAAAITSRSRQPSMWSSTGSLEKTWAWFLKRLKAPVDE
jgi:hypothetical protein